jgi:chaperone required for assembly of F1-ATPase
MSEASKTPAEPARRFYKQAVAQALDGAFTVALDGRTLKTPAGAPFRVPTMALAQACALEWRAQGERVLPAAMAITQLAFAAIDWTGRDRTSRINYIASYGETDLCCHRAGSPEGLVARQAATWDPLVAWGRRELGVVLPVVTGIVAARAASETLAAISERAALLDDFHLTALSQATGLSGSMLIAFALLYGEVDAQRAFEAAALDDLWSLERWGEDAEARTRLMRMRAEFDALAAFIACLSA